MIHLQKAMNASAEITGLVPSPSFDGVRPPITCVLASKRHVFYEVFDAPVGHREMHVFYCAFGTLRGVRKWRELARGSIFVGTLANRGGLKER